MHLLLLSPGCSLPILLMCHCQSLISSFSAFLTPAPLMSSLGWLAGENTLVRRNAKPIEGIQSGTVGDLRAALYAKESEVRSGTRIARSKFKPLDASPHNDPLDRSGKVNAGLDNRRARDEAAHASAAAANSTDAELAASAAHMRTKAAVYESLVAGGVGAEGHDGAFLVDFQRKGFEREDESVAHIHQQLEHSPTMLASMSDSIAAPSSKIDAAASSSGMISTRSEWERRALAAVGSSATAGGAAAATAAPTSIDERRRTSRAQLEADVKAEGQTAREKIALERRKRKAIVTLRRELLHEQQTRKVQLQTARTPLEREQLVRQLYMPLLFPEE
jgi:hypothetical protein